MNVHTLCVHARDVAAARAYVLDGRAGEDEVDDATWNGLMFL